MATVRFLVDDVSRCVAFYVDALGFEEIERYGAPQVRWVQTMG